MPSWLLTTRPLAVVLLAFAGLTSGCGSSAPSASSSSATPAAGTPANTAVASTAKSTTSATAAPKGWGSLTGKFVYEGKPPERQQLDVNKDVKVCGKEPQYDESLIVSAAGGIANVVLYVRSKNVTVHPDLQKLVSTQAVLDNINCRFEPHIACVLVGQSVLFKNSDPVGHNTNCSPPGDAALSPLLAPGGDTVQRYSRSQFVPTPVSCNIHPWMKGYVLIRDNPYFAVSKEDGSFEIANLPAGELEFQVWHEKSGYVSLPGWDKGRFKLNVQVGANDLGTKSLPASLFNN